MLNTEYFKNLIENKKIFVYLIILFVFGVIMLLMSKEEKPTDTVSDKNASITFSDPQYSAAPQTELEQELESILSLVDGLGETRVMINYYSSSEKIPMMEESNSSQKIIEQNTNGDIFPYISKEIYPKIEGVIIVAEGGGDAALKSEISSAVSETLNIPLHKVRILKMNIGG